MGSKPGLHWLNLFLQIKELYTVKTALLLKAFCPGLKALRFVEYLHKGLFATKRNRQRFPVFQDDIAPFGFVDA